MSSQNRLRHVSQDSELALHPSHQVDLLPSPTGLLSSEPGYDPPFKALKFVCHSAEVPEESPIVKHKLGVRSKYDNGLLISSARMDNAKEKPPAG